jgi:hypothetical protein
VNWEVASDFSDDINTILITWGTRKYRDGENQTGLFDFTKKKFAWLNKYDRFYTPTLFGLYFKDTDGTFVQYKDGDVIKSNTYSFFSEYYASLFYSNGCFLYNISDRVDIYRESSPA